MTPNKIGTCEWRGCKPKSEDVTRGCCDYCVDVLAACDNWRRAK